MRWKASLELDQGAMRIIKRFLFLPVCLEDEWRWLETAYIKQRVEKVPFPFSLKEYKWRNILWSDKLEYDDFP